MSDSKKKISTEADDVFEFLDSLPQSNSFTNTSSPAGGSEQKDANKQDGSLVTGEGPNGNENKEDILEFLEELEKSTNNNGSDTKNKITQKEKKKADTDANAGPSVKEPIKHDADDTANANDTASIASLKDKRSNDAGMEDREDSPLNDPITSFANWWSKSGSDKVSKIWNKTQEQASQFRDKLIENDAVLPVVNLSNLKDNLNTNNLLSLTDQITKNLTKIVVGDTEEVLRIHLVHDLINLSYLQYYVEEKFDQVMSSQVEGGIRIFVDEWGKPNNNTVNKNYNNNVDSNGHANENNSNSSSSNSINEFRQKIDLNLFQGKINDGDKLAFANLDNSIELFNKAHEAILQQQQEDQKVSNNNNNNINDNISDIFISILPISIPSTSHSNNADSNANDDSNDEIIKTIDTTSPNNFHFTVVLKDISNDITCIARSQSFPLKWLHWLQGSKIQTVAVEKGNSEDNKKNKSDDDDDDSKYNGDDGDEEIIVDPSEWVQQWIEDGIALVIGVVAQNYVIERMGF
ncbi:DUF5427 domain-containing protein MTC1 PWA37_005267 [Arxiozyma heterogenica]|uniref:DUF5427 domain-containing protein MTC1 n=1 Tax=Arxiozyma heterogenica TaxID=278026 RepID=UPI002EECE9EA